MSREFSPGAHGMVIDQSGELSYIMNKAPSSSRANLTIGRLSGSGSASSSEMSSDSDSETASSKGGW